MTRVWKSRAWKSRAWKWLCVGWMLGCTAEPLEGSSTSDEPTGGEMPTTGEVMATTGEPPASCGEALTAEQCAIAVSPLEFEGCNWVDLYALDVSNATCEFTPVQGQGVCVDPTEGDTSCGSLDTCDFSNVYYRTADDGTLQVVRTGSECGTYGPTSSEWVHCAAPDEPEDTSGSGGSSTGAGDESTGGAPELDACACGCDAFPA